MLLESLDNFLNAALPCPEGCYTGARPGIQCLDIAHGLQTVVEKVLDSLGAAALAHADIERYYDSVFVLLIIRWFMYRRDPKAPATLLLRIKCVHKLL